MISARGLSKHYAGAAALVDVSLDLRTGECVAIAGPAGSGRSTLLRLLATLVEPSEGSILIDGLSPETHLLALRQRIAYAAPDTLMGTRLRVDEYLRFALSSRRGRTPTTPAADPEGAARRAGLDPADSVDRLLPPARAALAGAVALAAGADVILLDDVVDHLTPEDQLRFADWIADVRHGGAAIAVATGPSGHPAMPCNRVSGWPAGASPPRHC